MVARHGHYCICLWLISPIHLLVDKASGANGRKQSFVMEGFAGVRRGSIVSKPWSHDPHIVCASIADHCCFQEYPLHSTHKFSHRAADAQQMFVQSIQLRRCIVQRHQVLQSMLLSRCR